MEIDEDGNGEVNFEEFANLATRFLIEDDEDTEAIHVELRGAFRLYDREGTNISTERTSYIKYCVQEMVS